MPEYRSFAAGHRDGFVRLGLELDLLADGSLLLHDDDRGGWDVFLGSIHTVCAGNDASLSQAELERLFLRDTERLLGHPIDVLGHPFRFFRRLAKERPRHLYPVVAQWLAESGKAAEINFHTNEPDPRFFEECLSRGVKVALGSDAHDLGEVGVFEPHLRCLREAGACADDLADILWRPGGSA
jgi:histidinol phosphatase-like PHP family hydrolase